MKIDKSTLKQLIKEEINGLVGADGDLSGVKDIINIFLRSAGIKEKQAARLAAAIARSIGKEYRVEKK